MKKALLIGIDKYPFAPLYGSVNDANKLAELLKKNQNDSPNFEVRTKTNIPDKNNFKKTLIDFFQGDSIISILYFSGHGIINEYGGGYLVTPDMREYDQGVAMDEILDMANNSKHKNKIIILDCCYSGVLGSPRILGGKSSMIQEGVTILTASRDNEPAKEYNGHGVFTYLLIEALKGGAADLRGHITPGSIYSFIDQSLGEFDQRPVFKTNITRFVSLREVTPQVSPEIFRNLVKYFPNPEQVFPLDPSYEDTNVLDYKNEPLEPYAIKEHVAVFKELQKLQSVGLVVPVDATFMFFAAMQSKSCKLTALGHHYWRLVNETRI